jgi:hypothetical protein
LFSVSCIRNLIYQKKFALHAAGLFRGAGNGKKIGNRSNTAVKGVPKVSLNGKDFLKSPLSVFQKYPLQWYKAYSRDKIFQLGNLLYTHNPRTLAPPH